MSIVHRDLKPENVLLSDSGHLPIADHDRSYAMPENENPPEAHDFCTALHFMARELANRRAITTKAHAWSLALPITYILTKPVQPNASRGSDVMRWARSNRYSIREVKKLSKSQQALSQSYPIRNHKERPGVTKARDLHFYATVDWDEVASGTSQSPCLSSQLTSQATLSDFVDDRRDPLLLEAAYCKKTPPVDRGLHYAVDGDGVPHVRTVPLNSEELAKVSLMPDKIEEPMAHFDSTSPLL